MYDDYILRDEIYFNGCTLRVEKLHHDGDISYLGEFSDDWHPDAIDRKDTAHFERHQYRYFIPAQSVDALSQALSDAGESRGPAWSKALASVRKMHELAESFGDDWYYVGLQVTLIEDGAEVDQLSLWGVDDGLPYSEGNQREFVDELIDELPDLSDDEKAYFKQEVVL